MTQLVALEASSSATCSVAVFGPAFSDPASIVAALGELHGRRATRVRVAGPDRHRVEVSLPTTLTFELRLVAPVTPLIDPLDELRALIESACGLISVRAFDVSLEKLNEQSDAQTESCLREYADAHGHQMPELKVFNTREYSALLQELRTPPIVDEVITSIWPSKGKHRLQMIGGSVLLEWCLARCLDRCRERR